MEVGERIFAKLPGLLGPLRSEAPRLDGLRSAGVLVPLRLRDGGITVVLARRTEQVPHHKGQICFPGGSRDPGDADLLETALREAGEELGIGRRDVEILGAMEAVRTVTGFCIQPFVGRLSPSTVLRLDDFEMAEFFEAPLAIFGDFDRYRYAESSVGGEARRVYFFDYGNRTIWGATAAILRRLAELADGRVLS